jgi:hypothetical protein
MTTAEYHQWFILSGIQMIKEKQRRHKERFRRPDKMDGVIQRLTNWLIYILPPYSQFNNASSNIRMMTFITKNMSRHIYITEGALED